ncbi:hypothetical protein BVRB_2g028350 [Beta vulgaris subsp. vulgaris]|nr:hypothetical protein BVRB_2g028350 [Beta vulgaris subsp. vulgaris]
MGGRKMMVTHKVIEAKDDHRVTKNPTSVFSGAPKVNDSSGFEVKGDVDMHCKDNDHTTSGYSSVKLNNEAFSTTDYHGPRSHPSKHH